MCVKVSDKPVDYSESVTGFVEPHSSDSCLFGDRLDIPDCKSFGDACPSGD